MVAAKPICLFAATKHEVAPVKRTLSARKLIKKSDSQWLEGTYDGIPIHLVITGMGGVRAQKTAARYLAYNRPPGAIILGVSGGLSEDFATGDLVLGSWVGKYIETNGDNNKSFAIPANLDRLDEIITRLAIRQGRLVSVDRLVCTADEKLKLHRQTGAVAVDLETHAIVSELSSKGIPWLALRAISDTLQENIPNRLQGLVDSGDNHRQYLWNLSKLAMEEGVLRIVDLKKRLHVCTARLGAVFRDFLEAF